MVGLVNGNGRDHGGGVVRLIDFMNWCREYYISESRAGEVGLVVLRCGIELAIGPRGLFTYDGEPQEPAWGERRVEITC